MIREIRLRQTEEGVAALQAWIDGWLEKRRNADRDAAGGYVGRHKTQLERIESVLGGSAKALAKQASDIKTTMSVGELYRKCRQVDEAAAWLQRVWQFYRERFDQRDDLPTAIAPDAGAAPGGEVTTLPSAGPTLRAADEIVWSTYHHVMKTAAAFSQVDHGAAPLAFIAPEYSPSALDTRRPLAQHLRLYIEFPTFDERLKSLVRRLAVPLLVLPSWCVNAPWWLVFVAHEVGHHLTKQLDLLDHFADAIDAAVKQGVGLPATLKSKWQPWADEIVADAWSLVLIGPAAAEAIAQVEMAGPDDLRAIPAPNTYPPPVIRLALMQRLSEKLGLGVPTLPSEFAIEGHQANATIAELYEQIPFVMGALLAPLPKNLGDLRALAQVDQTPATAQLAKDVRWWQDNVLARPVDAAKSLEAARLLSAATFKAWREIGETAGEANPNGTTTERLADVRLKSDSLAHAALEVFAAAGPGGERAAEQPDGAAPGLAKEFTDLLLALGSEEGPGVGNPHDQTI